LRAEAGRRGARIEEGQSRGGGDATRMVRIGGWKAAYAQFRDRREGKEASVEVVTLTR
jgi:hypothetical protein